MAAPPIQQGMKCSGSLITCRPPESLGSSFKSLLDIRKQALALPVKHHQLPGATDHTTPFYEAVSHTAGGICSCSCIRIIHQSHPTTTHPAQHLVALPHGPVPGTKGQPCPCQGQPALGAPRQSWEHILCLRAGGKGPGGGTKQPCPARAAAGPACVPAGWGMRFCWQFPEREEFPLCALHQLLT